MSHFFKHVLVRFFSHKNGNDTELSEISNDELVTALEWVTQGETKSVVPFAYAEAISYSECWPVSVRATLRKLGAA